MATSYKTPGVYIEEISKFPPSVAQVETAIPAFIGYTKFAIVNGVDFHSDSIIKPVKISSLPEFELFFGGAPEPRNIIVDLNADYTVKSAQVNGVNLLYDTIRMFYANGGGDCYIVSVGAYNNDAAEVDKQELLRGLASLEKVDLPTLLVIPETVYLGLSEAGEVHAAMLSQCNKLQDRFAVLDIVNGDQEITPSTDPVADFRDNVGMNYLKYGAVYYPWLKTTLSYKIDFDTVINGDYTIETVPLADIKTLLNSEILNSIEKIEADIAAKSGLTVPVIGDIVNRGHLESTAQNLYAYFKAFFGLNFTDNNVADPNSAVSIHAKFVKDGSNFDNLLTTLFDYNYFSTNGANIPASWTTLFITDNFGTDFSPLGFTNPAPASKNDIYGSLSTAVNASTYFKALLGKLKALINRFYTELEAVLQNRTETLLEVDPVYRNIVETASGQGVVLPPSGAVVGKYASVDRERGVWKAPANVSITAVKGPVVNITHEEQESLNVDTEAGKSVNAIRAFTGKGTLIWGARTLAGNDNEWKYVPVRRFFNMVEESVKKATSQFVFEPNDANTWIKIRAMIENFLSLQWRAGALAGAKPEDAYYVRVGLGQTMTAQDILKGYMLVEIGMAVVRPAEFIVLKFSHKMQES